MNIKNLIKENEKEIIDIRREFHMYPELSEKEFDTMNRICSYLDKWDIEYEKNIAETGVVAIIRGEKPGKTIGARADIDALPICEETDLSFKSKNPGVMHACGHDVHTAIHLGMAKILKQVEKELEGNVKIFFQPAEETIGGAKRMIEQGVLKNPDVDNVIGLHVEESLEVGEIMIKKGKVNAATNEMIIKVKGSSGHAAYPERAIDGIVIAGNIITGLQSLVSRNVSPLNPIVLTLGKINGGTKSNVIAGEVIITGTLRTLDQDTRNFAENRVREICEYIGRAYGGQVEVEFPIPGAFEPLINDGGVVDIIVEESEKIIGTENIFWKEQSSMGGDDFAFFTAEVPSAYYFLGSGHDIAAHSEGFLVDEDCIAIGMEIQLNTILRLLEK